MRLTIKYFGMLAEITDCTEETIDFSKNTVDELLENLYARYPHLARTEFKVAINQDLSDDRPITDQSEIALLPPFSGG